MTLPLKEMFRLLPEDPALDGPDFGLYLLTNEGQSLDTLRQMQHNPLTGQIGMGVSGFFTLDIAAVRPETEENKLEGVVLVDCSLRVRHFMRAMIERLKISPSRLDMQEFVRSEILSNAKFYYEGALEPADLIARNYIERFNHSLQDCALGSPLSTSPHLSSSWLSDETRFEKMKRLATLGNITFLCIDFNQKPVLTKFISILEKRAPLDFAYISNIYLDRLSTFKAVANQLQTVVGPNTYFIDTERFYPVDLKNNQRLQQRKEKPLYSIMERSCDQMRLFAPDGLARFFPKK